MRSTGHVSIIVTVILLSALVWQTSHTAGAGGGPSPAKDRALADDKLSEKLVDRAAARLAKLAAYLDQQATIASEDVNVFTTSIRNDSSPSAINETIEKAGKRSRSAVAKQAIEEVATDPLKTDAKISAGGLIAKVEEKTKTYRGFAGHLRQLAASVKGELPDQALTKLGDTYVPPAVEDVLSAEQGKLKPSLSRGLAPVPVTTVLPESELQSYLLGSPRVSGTGAKASVDYPSVVAIQQDLSSDQKPQYVPWCSGTLIAPSVVLSAAHCFCEYDSQQQVLQAEACKNKIFNLNNGSALPALDPSYRRVYLQHGGIREIERIEINDEFQFPKADLAIVYLKEPVLDIKPMVLNTFKEVPFGTEALIVGFGRHSLLDQFGNPVTEYAGFDDGLKFFARTKTSECTGKHKDINLICWQFSKSLPQSLRDQGNTCNGDSGGPLFAQIGGISVLIGVTSGGKLDDCGLGDTSFDVDVYAYREWINARVASRPVALAALASALLPLDGNGKRFHFAKSTWQFHPSSQFYTWPLQLPSTVQRLRIGVNTNRVMQSALRLRIVDGTGAPVKDPSGKPFCDIETEDASATCEIANQPSAAWRVEATGPGSKWFQIVATGF